MKRTSHYTSRFTLILYKSLVGYKSEDLVDGKINMKGFTFSTVAGEPISLNEITGEGLVAGEDDTCADQVLVGKVYRLKKCMVINFGIQ